MPKPELKLDWATHEAAKYAVMHWHYSKVMPTGKLVKIGVWENSKYIGVVIFGKGATPKIASPYGLHQTEVSELVRVALTKHIAPVTKIISIAFKMLRKYAPKTKVIVSFADPMQDHHGGIYQGGNWVYEGVTEYKKFPVIDGVLYHPRSAVMKFGTWGESKLKAMGHHIVYQKRIPKHKYSYFFDKKYQVEGKPYPKRDKHR